VLQHRGASPLNRHREGGQRPTVAIPSF